MTTHANSNHWSNHQERTVLWGMRFLFAVYRYLGRIPFLIVLGPVILFYWLSDPQLRKNSMDYLQHAYLQGLLKTKPTRWMTLAHLMRFADTILDKMAALSGENVDDMIRVEGKDCLLKMVNDKRGAIVLTSHMGCIEALQAYGNRLADVPIHILVHTKHSSVFNSLLADINPLNRLTFTEVSELTPAFAFKMQEAIDQGALLFVAGDRVPVQSNATVNVTFLGEKAAFPSGGPILANLFHCPLIQMTCIRDHAKYNGRLKRFNHYRVRFQLLSENVRLNRRDRHADMQQLMQRFAQELEWAIGESPLDWFNFYPFWSQTATKDTKHE